MLTRVGENLPLPCTNQALNQDTSERQGAVHPLPLPYTSSGLRVAGQWHQPRARPKEVSLPTPRQLQLERWLRPAPGTSAACPSSPFPKHHVNAC